MPKITLMPSGINAAFPGGNSAPPKRGTVRGLTQGSARRCKAFLMSIDAPKLDGVPITMTFTLRDIPSTSDEWDRLKRLLWDRLKRLGMIRCHFVTEWTKRGVPHLHAMGFFQEFYHWTMWSDGERLKLISRVTSFDIVSHWCEIAAAYGAGPMGQHVRIEDGSINVAWFKYMSKHASRSAHHYQRQAELVPEGWQSTGRMWGKIGAGWPTHSETHEIDDWAFFALRRQVRRLRRSQALCEIRKGIEWGNLVQQKSGLSTLRYLRSHKRIVDPARSATVPISEWVSSDVAMHILEGIYCNIEPRQTRREQWEQQSLARLSKHAAHNALNAL